jgi:hypothetical protein
MHTQHMACTLVQRKKAGCSYSLAAYSSSPTLSYSVNVLTELAGPRRLRPRDTGYPLVIRTVRAIWRTAVPELRLHETAEEKMSESTFGTNAGVDGEQSSYDADVSAATDSDDAADADLTYAATDTSRTADEAAAYEEPAADAESPVLKVSPEGEVSPVDESGPVDEVGAVREEDGPGD